MRSSKIDRKTRETDIKISLNIDGKGSQSVKTGIKFLDHMLISLARHGSFDLEISAKGDNEHHIVEDVAIALGGAFRDAFNKTQACLLEPIMDVEVRVPEDFMGDVKGDISSRRGKIMGMETEGSFQVIKAKIPQSELYHYSTAIRSLTGGRGLHSESFSHYEYLPQELQKRFINESQKDDNE